MLLLMKYLPLMILLTCWVKCPYTHKGLNHSDLFYFFTTHKTLLHILQLLVHQKKRESEKHLIVLDALNGILLTAFKLLRCFLPPSGRRLPASVVFASCILLRSVVAVVVEVAKGQCLPSGSLPGARSTTTVTIPVAIAITTITVPFSRMTIATA